MEAGVLMSSPNVFSWTNNGVCNYKWSTQAETFVLVSKGDIF